ncbi:MAG: hypothetical protein ACYDAC_12480 [Candidatus Dormibacteria bacterium]
MSSQPADAPVTLALATAGLSVISLVLRPVGPRGPWPLTTSLTALADVERDGIARALGDRHGIPLIHSAQLRWRGLQVTLEARHAEGGPDEMTVELPSWDELDDAGAGAGAWDLVDRVAVAADAVFGSAGDGEAPLAALPESGVGLRRAGRRHLALLLPGWMVADAQGAGLRHHGNLPGSGLAVLTG